MEHRFLAVFDFDNTIVNENSDIAVIDLIGKNNIPNDIRKLQHNDGWTAFMQAVFQLALEKGVTAENITEHVKTLAPVTGIPQLIAEMKNTGKYDIIIISDSNTRFIEAFLDKHSLQWCISKVFSNPAEVENDLLKITPYHYQESCKLSTKNLCKGQILEDFVGDQMKLDITYDQIVYIGDGANDFCPVLRLTSNDLACVRNNFKLNEIVAKTKSGKSLDHTGQPHVINAEVLVWENGDDILKKIQK